jgi:predicted negative regulator of RcsB-dependent stress response
MLSHVAKNEARDARYIADNLITNYSDSPYAAMSALTMARLEIVDGQSEEARKHLKWTIDNAKLPALKETAQVRMAKLILSEGKADEAWTTVSAVGHCKQMVTCMELKGDILIAQGKVDEARSTYLQAISLAETDKSELSVIQLKLDDLGSL